MVYADVNILGGRVHTIERNTEAVVVASKEIGGGEADKLSTWSCVEIRLQDDITIQRLIIVPLKGWNSSDIREQL